MLVMPAQLPAVSAASCAPREILLIFISPVVTLTMSAQKFFPIPAIKRVKALMFAQSAEIIRLQVLALEQGLLDQLLHPMHL
jgi:hypothetical protein